jgi:hypothetical protein
MGIFAVCSADSRKVVMIGNQAIALQWIFDARTGQICVSQNFVRHIFAAKVQAFNILVVLSIP